MHAVVINRKFTVKQFLVLSYSNGSNKIDKACAYKMYFWERDIFVVIFLGFYYFFFKEIKGNCILSMYLVQMNILLYFLVA